MAQLTCQNLCAGYDGRPVLQDLSFEILAGDYLCIVGENGSGKSTLMKTILGLQTPISGRISTGDGLRKNEIGYLPQQTVVQKDFPAAVREIVLSGCQGRCGSRPFYNKEEKKLAVDAMEKMQITRLARRCYSNMFSYSALRLLNTVPLCSPVLDACAYSFSILAIQRKAGTPQEVSLPFRIGCLANANRASYR